MTEQAVQAPPAAGVTGEAVFSSFDGLLAEGNGVLAPLRHFSEILELRGQEVFAALEDGGPDAYGLFVQPFDFGSGPQYLLGVVQLNRDHRNRPAVFGAAVSVSGRDCDLEAAVNHLIRIVEGFYHFHETQFVRTEGHSGIGFLEAQRVAERQSLLQPVASAFYRIDPKMSPDRTVQGLMAAVAVADAATRVIAFQTNADGLSIFSEALITDIEMRLQQQEREARLRRQIAKAQRLEQTEAARRSRPGGDSAQAVARGGVRRHPDDDGSDLAMMLVGGLDDMVQGLRSMEQSLPFFAGEAIHLDRSLGQARATGYISPEDTLRLVDRLSQALDSLSREIQSREKTSLRQNSAAAATNAPVLNFRQRSLRGTESGGLTGLVRRRYIELGAAVLVLSLAALTTYFFLLFPQERETDAMAEPSPSVAHDAEVPTGAEDTMRPIDLFEVPDAETLPEPWQVAEPDSATPGIHATPEETESDP